MMKNLPLSDGSRKKKYGGFAFFIALIGFLVLIVCFNATYTKVIVVGDSMEDTLHSGDYVYITQASLARGDIVVLKVIETSNGEEISEKNIIKRVVAVGGDSVALDAGYLVVNGEYVWESYISDYNKTPTEGDPLDYSEIVVPEGEIFCLGDNRHISADSRVYGTFSVDCVVGVVAPWSITLKGALTKLNNLFGSNLSSALN